MNSDGRHDFDFLLGTWRVHNRKLTTPLAGGGDWIEFETRAEARPVLDGLGNVDSFRYDGDMDGGPWEGFTLRLHDPAAALWRIWWSSTKRPGHLDPPLVGRFDFGMGTFLGDDTFGGRDIRVRFYWKDITPTSARWVQAFSPDGGDTWETNWVMTLHRLGSASQRSPVAAARAGR